MTDVPERIWTVADKDERGGRQPCGLWRVTPIKQDSTDKIYHHSPVEYIRADLSHDAAQIRTKKEVMFLGWGQATVDGRLVEASGLITRAEAEAMVLAEREACAVVADAQEVRASAAEDNADDNDTDFNAGVLFGTKICSRVIATAIRDRSKGNAATPLSGE
jgi:hypothetical protein